MKNITSKLCAVVFSSAIMGVTVLPSEAGTPPVCFQPLVNRIDAQSTVMIAVIPIHLGQSRYRTVIQGSGIVLAGSRQIVTAAHVADSSRKSGYITEIFNNKGSFVGFASIIYQKNKVSGEDYTGSVTGDVAFMKIDSVSGRSSIDKFRKIPGVYLAKHQIPSISIMKTGNYLSGEGMSGGGIFNNNGRLAGILIAGGSSIPGLPTMTQAKSNIFVTSFKIRARVAQSAIVSKSKKQSQPEYMIGSNVSNNLIPQNPSASNFVLAGYPDLSCSSGYATNIGSWSGNMIELKSGYVRIQGKIQLVRDNRS